MATLTQLIARGAGAGVASPVERFRQAKIQQGELERNRLANMAERLKLQGLPEQQRLSNKLKQEQIKTSEADRLSPKTKFQKGAKFLVDGKVIQGRFNPTLGENELPDGQGGFVAARDVPNATLMTTSTDLEIGPDGTIKFKTGLGDQTIKTQSAHEREVDQGEELALEAKSIFNTLRSEDVGFRGVIGEGFVDKTIGQVFDSVVNKDRIKNRTAMRALREKGLRFMTTDTRFNKADRDAVETLFPSDGVFESLPSAQAKLTMFNELITDRVDKSAGRLGRKPLTEMSSDEIVEAVKNKELNIGTAKRALMLFHGFDE